MWAYSYKRLDKRYIKNSNDYLPRYLTEEKREKIVRIWLNERFGTVQMCVLCA